MKHLNRFIRKFIRDQRGVVIIMFAFLLNIFVIMLALNLDLGRAFMARTTISSAVDSAALAAGHAQGNLDDARTYFEANLPSGKYGINYDFDENIAVSYEDGESKVLVQANNLDVPYRIGFVGGNVASGKVSDLSEVVAAGASPPFVDYYFIADASNSMDAPNSANPTNSADAELRYKSIKNALRVMIDQLSTYDNSEELYTFSAVSYGTNIGPQFTEFANLAYFTDAKLDQLVNPTQGNTCGECGLERIIEAISNNPRANNPDRLQVVVFMTDGYFNTYQAGSAPKFAWPMNIEQNQCLGLCGNVGTADELYESLNMSSPADWANQATGLNSPFYDQALQAGEFNEACDPSIFQQSYPLDIVSFPEEFNEDFKDQCMPAYAAVANKCDEMKSLAENVRLYTIRYGDFTTEAAERTAFAYDMTVETLNFCATDPTYSRPALNGDALEGILQEIVRSNRQLRIIQ